MYITSKKSILLIILFVLSLGSSQVTVSSNVRTDYNGIEHVFVITVDGLRYDTFDDTNLPELPAFEWALDHGVRMSTTVPNPTLTATGHVSISSGANASVHGIMGNTFYDWKDNQSYSLFDSDTDPYRNTTTGASTLLSTQGYHWAPENGKESLVVGWPYSEGEYQGMSPSVYVSYDSVSSLPDPYTAEKILDALDENPDVALTYAWFHGVDNPSHYDGVRSDRYYFNLGKTDEAFLKLFSGLKERGMLESSTFFILGDHGFIDTDDSDFFIEQTDLWDTALAEIDGKEPIIADDAGFVYLYWENAANVNRTGLEAFKAVIETHQNVEAVYINEEHEPLGLYNTLRGMNMSIWLQPNVTRNFGSSFKGMHGYLNSHPEMQSTLIALGAGIDSSSLSTKALGIDITPTALELLDLPVLPSAQGTAMTHILTDVAGLTGNDLPVEETSSESSDGKKSNNDDSPLGVFSVLSALFVTIVIFKRTKKLI